jgi:hypothetical protein
VQGRERERERKKLCLFVLMVGSALLFLFVCKEFIVLDLFERKAFIS